MAGLAHPDALVEARVFRLTTREDVDAYARDLGIEMMRVPRAVRPILCAAPARRVFYTADDAQEHLAPVLQPDELGRVRSFLDVLPAFSSR